MAKRRAVTLNPDDDLADVAVMGTQPRTRTVRTMTEEEVPVNGGESGDASEGEELSPLDQLLAELGGGTEYDIAVYRMDKTKPNGRVFCGPLSAGGLNNSSMVCTRLQTEFGGGDFYLQVKDPETSSFVRRIVVSVEIPKTPPAQLVQESVAASIRAAMEPMQAVLAQLVANQNSRPALNLDALAASAIKFFPLLQMARGLLAPAQNEFSLEKYLDFKTKMDALGLGDSEPNSMAQAMQLFKEFGKPLLEAVQNNQNRLPLQPGPMHNPNAGRATPSHPVAAPGAGVSPRSAPGMGFGPVATGPGQSTASNIAQQIAPFVGVITTMAQGNEPPESAAEKILSVLPENMIDPLCDAIESGELVSVLTREMMLAGYSVWLGQVGAAILEQTLPETGEETQTNEPAE